MLTTEYLIERYKVISDFFYINQNNITQKSKHWQNYFKNQINKKNLENFRNKTILSEALDDQNNENVWIIFDELKRIINEEYILDNLCKSNFGNADRIYKHKDRYVDYNKLIHIYWFYLIEKFIFKNNKIFSFVKLVEGLESFAELIIRKYNLKYISIDLPEANLLASYYLSRNFPDKKLFFVEEKNL